MGSNQPSRGSERPPRRRGVPLVSTALLLVVTGPTGCSVTGVFTDDCRVDDLRAAAAEVKRWPGVSPAPDVVDLCDSLESPYVSFSVRDRGALEQKLTTDCDPLPAHLRPSLPYRCRLAGFDGTIVIDHSSGEFSFDQ